MGSLLTCTGASCWSDMARWCFVSVFKGRAIGNHFPFSYSESGVLSLNFQLDRERPCFVRTPNQRHSRAKGAQPRPQTQAKHTGRLFMLLTMVPKMQVFLRIGARASLFAESYKNASWVRNFWFTIVVYVNIKQFSGLNTAGKAHMCTGVRQD